MCVRGGGGGLYTNRLRKNCTPNVSTLQLTHKSSKVERSLVPLVHGLWVAPLHKQERDHLQVAIVGSMVEGGLARAITNVKVTEVRNQSLCVQVCHSVCIITSSYAMHSV